MKLCPECNTTLEDDAPRCRRCGKWVISKRERTGVKPRRRSARVRILVLGGLAVLAWAVWAMPEDGFRPGEILGSEPSRSQILEVLRSDLERLQKLEEEYFRTHGEYSGAPLHLGFTATEGVSISIIAMPTGWSGAATFRDHHPDIGCAVFEGSAHPPRTPIRPREAGRVACTAPPA